MSFLRHSCKSTFDGPARYVKPGKESPILNTSCSRPLCNSFRNPIKFNVMVTAGVICLFCICTPFAVPFAIGSTVVDTVQSQGVFVSRKHIIVERLERRAPFWADGDTTPSISFEVNGLWVCTPLVHSVPYSPYSSTAHSVDSVRKRSCVSRMLTSTTSGMPCSQMARVDRGVRSTFTHAVPTHSAPLISILGSIEDSKMSICVTSQVNYSLASLRCLVYGAVRHYDSFQSFCYFQLARPRIGQLSAHNIHNKSGIFQIIPAEQGGVPFLQS